MGAKIISFATQKGGSGKTTLLMLTAAAIHNRTGKKILVIDSDTQRSVKEIYKVEKEMHPQAKPYDVIAFNWKQPNAEENFQKTIQLAEDKYDVIFNDIPGKMDGKEVYYSIFISDIVVVPIVASALDLQATVDFLRNLPDIRKDKESLGYKLDVFGVINKKDNSLEHKKLHDLNGLGGMQLFYSPISQNVGYKRGISTIFDIVDPKADHEFNRYFDEFMVKCLS
jgi:chromosome partitioning protein